MRKESQNMERFCFENIQKIFSEPWFKKVSCDRKFITFINRLKSGHVRSNSHLFNKNIIVSSNCTCCNMPQTAENLFFNCNNYREECEKLKNDLYMADSSLLQDLDTLLFCCELKVWKLLYNFSVKNNVIIRSQFILLHFSIISFLISLFF